MNKIYLFTAYLMTLSVAQTIQQEMLWLEVHKEL